MMFPLRPPGSAAFDPVLVRSPIMLRPPQKSDFRSWAALRTESRAHLIRWEDAWDGKSISQAAFRRRIKAWERQRRTAAGLALLAFHIDGETMIGGVSLSHIKFGASQSCVLGYWVGSRFLRRGYGRLMVEETLKHAFETIGLNRIEAACQPENEASAHLLNGLGFRSEGRARDFLKINGSWRDHDIYALTGSEWSLPGGR